jgi:hypothetical protein
MDCQKCNELLAAYKHAVGLYMTAERNIRGLVWDDFQLAFKELEHLAQACMDANAVLAHGVSTMKAAHPYKHLHRPYRSMIRPRAVNREWYCSL